MILLFEGDYNIISELLVQGTVVLDISYGDCSHLDFFYRCWGLWLGLFDLLRGGLGLSLLEFLAFEDEIGP